MTIKKPLSKKENNKNVIWYIAMILWLFWIFFNNLFQVSVATTLIYFLIKSGEPQ